jgi:hypothetical protein
VQQSWSDVFVSALIQAEKILWIFFLRIVTWWTVRTQQLLNWESVLWMYYTSYK